MRCARDKSRERERGIRGCQDDQVVYSSAAAAAAAKLSGYSVVAVVVEREILEGIFGEEKESSWMPAGNEG